MNIFLNAAFPSRKSIAALLTCTALAACGGGGGGGPDEEIPTSDLYVQFSNTSSTEDSPLGYVAINNAGSLSSGNAGSLNHNGGSVDGGLLAGDINNGRTLIDLAGGGSATLTNPANTFYSRVFSTSGLSNDRFGVVGSATVSEEIPDAGSSTYNGRVILDANNGDATFALNGNAEISVAWGASNDVDATFSNLSGTKNDGVSSGVDLDGIVTINNASLNGSGFSGGSFGTTIDDFTYDGGGSLTNQGQFFGPDATEAGGVFNLNDNSLNASGVFTTKGDLD